MCPVCWRDWDIEGTYYHCVKFNNFSYSVSLMNLIAHVLAAYMFRIAISSWCPPLASMQCPTLFLLIGFCFMSVLSDIKTATLAFFFSLFVWTIFFLPFFYCDDISIFDSKGGFLDTIERWILFRIKSVSLYL